VDLRQWRMAPARSGRGRRRWYEQLPHDFPWRQLDVRERRMAPAWECRWHERVHHGETGAKLDLQRGERQLATARHVSQAIPIGIK